MKKYKDVEPVETINKIKKILGDCGILTSEAYIDNKLFFSCRVNIANNRVKPLKIGTNGKGVTYEFSLASGYAEFMERLQNNMLIFAKRFAHKDFLENSNIPSSYVDTLKDKGLIFDYYYSRDESMKTLSEVLANNETYLNQIYNQQQGSAKLNLLLNNKYADDTTFICMPYYSARHRKTIDIPIELYLSLTGSNGMSAGNTKIEAMLQGLCEIFERYAITQIYNNELTPPTIPYEYFQSTSVYNKILYITKELGYKLIIKDCSLGKGLPVIGVIIVDSDNLKYNFKIASDFVPEIALERCLTEIYQGVKYFKSVDYKLLTLNDIDRLYERNGAQINLAKIFVNGSGYWPMSIFEKTHSYEFSEFKDNSGISNESDLQIAKQIVFELGFDILVRDNSTLGFPAFHIIIPGMSQITSGTDVTGIDSFFEDIVLIRELGYIDSDTIRKLATTIDENFNVLKAKDLIYTQHYIYSTDEELLNLDIELLEFMLLFYLQEFDSALKYLGLFLEKYNSYSHQYYFAVYDFVKMIYIDQFSAEKTEHLLSIKYSEELVSELFMDLSNPKNIFRYHNFPKGFDFTSQELDETCSLIPILKIEKQIDNYSLQNQINQNELDIIFYD